MLKMVINVNVEYCGTCGYAAKFEEMRQVLETKSNVNVTGFAGRRASFEVKVNDTLVHSKLNTMAFPDFEDISNVITEFEANGELRTCKQQPITNCTIV